jgi:hypothetical protein
LFEAFVALGGVALRVNGNRDQKRKTTSNEQRTSFHIGILHRKMSDKPQFVGAFFYRKSSAN